MEEPAPMPRRISPTEQIRSQIADLFASGQELGVVLEQVARLGVRLLMQTALEAERYRKPPGDVGSSDRSAAHHHRRCRDLPRRQAAPEVARLVSRAAPIRNPLGVSGNLLARREVWLSAMQLLSPAVAGSGSPFRVYSSASATAVSPGMPPWDMLPGG